MLMTGVILVAKPDRLFQTSHQEVESNVSLKEYYIGVCLALTAAFCGATVGITTKMLQGKKIHSKDLENFLTVKKSFHVWIFHMGHDNTVP